jgi:UDP-N-acetylmuramoyl-tripeptide--D-alanyl-D-alanine ligase
VDQSADFRASDVRESLTDVGFSVAFRLCSPLGECAVQLNVGGRHNVRNAAAAAAAAVQAGATLADVAKGLAAMQPVAGRLKPVRTRRGARLIDDSYNANPSSMRAGIDVLTGLPGSGWLVMGDMGELGDHAAVSHTDIGAYARERGVQRLFATGPLSRLAVDAFGTGGSWHVDVESMAQAVDEQLPPDVALLVKGSRFNRLERVVARLTGTTVGETH